mmetsp:Transcript_13850/g.49705  ORF Transcript_13850/g.49705 Transcript_13850/m.49705 type:complete len:401 (+) Transcript_13850:634-1836(+)
MEDERVDEIRVSNRVHGGDDDRRVRRLLRDRRVLLRRRPLRPLPGRLIKHEVVHRRAVRVRNELRDFARLRGHPNLQLLGDVAREELSKHRVELHPALLVHARAYGPHEREQEQRVEPHRLQELVHLRDFLFVAELVEQRLVETHERLREVDLLHRLRLLAHLRRDAKARRDEPVEHSGDLLLLRLVQRRRERVEPGQEHRPPAEQRGLDVDHPAPRDGGGGRHGQVRDFEDHVHEPLHRDDLAAVQTQLLVVVEHRVHVFDPNRVDGAVQHEPLPVRARVVRESLVHHREDAVLPLLRLRVALSVQLTHRDRLRVHALELALHLSFLAALRHDGERAREDAIGARLAAERLPDDHEAVTHDDHLVQLRRFEEEVRVRLEVHLRACLVHRGLHLRVVRLG